MPPTSRFRRARTLSSQVERSLVNERLVARLLSAFAALALLLAAVGLYGVLGYYVARRTGEIGLRLALGATRGAVLALGAAAVGDRSWRRFGGRDPGGAVLSRPLGGLLYGVTPSDPAVLLGAVACLFLVAMAAAAVPAWRAARVDPLVALRQRIKEKSWLFCPVFAACGETWCIAVVSNASWTRSCVRRSRRS